MKIVFDALKTRDGIVSVSYDGGTTYQDYNVSQVKDTGIDLDDNQDLSLIKIKSTTKVIDTFDVIKNIVVKEEPMFVMNLDYNWPYCVEGINFPKTLTSLDETYVKTYDMYGIYQNEDGYAGLDYFPRLETIKISENTNIQPIAIAGCIETPLLSNCFSESITGGYYSFIVQEKGVYYFQFSEGPYGNSTVYVYINGEENRAIYYEHDCKFILNLEENDNVTFKYTSYEDDDPNNIYNPDGDEEFEDLNSIEVGVYKINCTFY